MSNNISGIFTKAKSNFGKMPKGKKVYAYLWMITGVLLITIIGLFVGLSKTSTQHNNDGKWSIPEPARTVASTLTFDDENKNGKVDVDELSVDGKKVLQIISFDSTNAVVAKDATTLTKDDIDIYNDLGYSNKWAPKNPNHVLVKVKDGVTAPANPAQNLKDAAGDASAKKIYDIDTPQLSADVKDADGHVTGQDESKLDHDFVFAKYLDGKRFDGKTDRFSYAPLKSYYTNSWGTWQQGTLTSKSAEQQNAIAAMSGIFAISVTASIFTTASVELMKKRKQKKELVGGKN